jgi:hypothetical protein
MPEIVLVRQFERLFTADDLHAAAAQAKSCLDIYGVRPRVHYLANDGRRCVCVFGAPDAEAMRNVLRTAGLAEPFGLWSATVHPGPADGPDPAAPPPEPAGTLAVVERSFPAPVTFEAVDADEKRSAFCFDSHRVQFVRSYFSADRRHMICLYAAPDAEAARQANAQAGLPFDRVWPARVVTARKA